MGLAANVEMSLTDAGLIDFYDDHIPAFKALAARAYSLAHENVTPTGLPLRKDDVATSLVTALEINEELRNYLAGKTLRQKFWYLRFADLVLDRLWKECMSCSDTAWASSPQPLRGRPDPVPATRRRHTAAPNPLQQKRNPSPRNTPTATNLEHGCRDLTATSVDW
jgi:hypothetical protein